MQIARLNFKNWRPKKTSAIRNPIEDWKNVTRMVA
jgi:hypothetical protein